MHVHYTLGYTLKSNSSFSPFLPQPWILLKLCTSFLRILPDIVHAYATSYVYNILFLTNSAGKLWETYFGGPPSELRLLVFKPFCNSLPYWLSLAMWLALANGELVSVMQVEAW